MTRSAAALRAFPSITRQLLAETEPDGLLRKIQTVAMGLLGASSVSLLIWDSDRNQLVFRGTGEEADEQTVGKGIAPDQGIAGWVFTHSQPLCIPDVRADERFCSEIDESLGDPYAALVAAPLLNDQGICGVIEAINKKTGEDFDEIDVDTLCAFASLAALAIENVRLNDKVKCQRQQFSTIEQDIHKKLARDLHDGPAQWLAGISMNLEYILRIIDINLPQARAELEGTRHKLDRTINQVRNLMFELRPVLLDSHDLETALKHYVDSLNQMDNMNISLRMEGLRTRLAPRTERAIFDIIREAISNIKRHAYTSRAWIDFRADGDDTLVVTIRDDGLGFDLSAVQCDYPRRGSLGMLNMTERASLIDGTLAINSVPSEGTLVTLRLPLQRP